MYIKHKIIFSLCRSAPRLSSRFAQTAQQNTKLHSGPFGLFHTDASHINMKNIWVQGTASQSITKKSNRGKISEGVCVRYVCTHINSVKEFTEKHTLQCTPSAERYFQGYYNKPWSSLKTTRKGRNTWCTILLST